MGKRKDGLTAKQRHFALEVATNGSSITAAYETAYECENMSRAAMRNEASKLMANPDIAMMVESIRSDNEAKKLQSLRALEVNDREKVLSRLREWMTTAEPSDTNKIAAARLLGQSVGLFKDVTISEDARSSDDIARQLEDRLANLLEGNDSEGVTSEQEPGSVH
jgi:hypothetical protein